VRLSRRELAASVTIVVTASHNPRGDNGYKVYGSNAVQIISPVDAEIARQIAAAPPARLVPCDAVRLEQASACLVDARQCRGPPIAILRPFPQRFLRGLPAVSCPSCTARSTASERCRCCDPRGSRLHARKGRGRSSRARRHFPDDAVSESRRTGTLDLALAEGQRHAAALVIVNDPTPIDWRLRPASMAC